MNIDTATLSRSITLAGSKQSFYTALLLVDRDLVNDCLRTYAYFRWADDIIDLEAKSREEAILFIERQKELVKRLYRNERPNNLSPEEEIIADLISNDRGENSGLRSFIHKFLAVLEFDAHRRGRPISLDELTWYSNCLGEAVTDAIQYFIQNGHPYPEGDNHYLAATAAHITHMLRDMSADIAGGYINIPAEYLEEYDISPEDMVCLPYQAWIRERVALARAYFQEGKRYLDGLDVLRCKIAGYWYCARFESVLEAIERDGYRLRAKYNERRKIVTWLKMAWLAFTISLQHYARTARYGSLQTTSNSNLKISTSK